MSNGLGNAIEDLQLMTRSAITFTELGSMERELNVKDETPEKYGKLKTVFDVRILPSLSLQGCGLSEPTDERLPRALPEFSWLGTNKTKRKFEH